MEYAESLGFFKKNNGIHASRDTYTSLYVVRSMAASLRPTVLSNPLDPE